MSLYCLWGMPVTMGTPHLLWEQSCVIYGKCGGPLSEQLHKQALLFVAWPPYPPNTLHYTELVLGKEGRTDFPGTKELPGSKETRVLPLFQALFLRIRLWDVESHTSHLLRKCSQENLAKEWEMPEEYWGEASLGLNTQGSLERPVDSHYSWWFCSIKSSPTLN